MSLEQSCKVFARSRGYFIVAIKIRDIVITALTTLAATTAAHADMGLAPAKPGDTYISGEGGYLLQDGPDINVFGISQAPGSVTDATLSTDDGWFAGIMIGYENGRRMISFLPFTRFEGFVFGGETDDSRSDTVPPLADVTLKSVDGSVNVTGGTSVQATTESRTVEFGYRSEFDQFYSPAFSVTWGLTSFFRNTQDETDVVCSNVCGLRRSADIDTWLYGTMLVAEPEYKIQPGISIVTRFGAGFYSYDIEGEFRSSSNSATSPDPFKAAVDDEDDGFGFRGALGAGLKFVLGPNALLETYAEADYFSDVGVARFSNSNPADGSPSRVDTDDLWELRTGARVTIGLGGAN